MTRALPAARTPDPMTAPSLRWGVIGTGWIAERFVVALRRRTGQHIVAVASRGRHRAEAFACKFGIPLACDSYAELVAADLDVVYVATGHPAHLPCARIALAAGKPVLVEKPLALDAAEARELTDLAAERGLFLMEALWTLALPKYDVIRQILESGMLGEIRTVMADIGENLTGNRRVMDPAMAGGPMHDLGTYVFMFANWVLPSLQVVAACGQDHPSGVTGQFSALLTDRSGRQAVVHSTVLTNTPVQAFVAGSAATLALDGPFYQPGGFEVRFTDGEALRYNEPATSHHALFWQAAEVARCVTSGLTSSPLRPPADSIATLALMDATRRLLRTAS